MIAEVASKTIKLQKHPTKLRNLGNRLKTQDNLIFLCSTEMAKEPNDGTLSRLIFENNSFQVEQIYYHQYGISDLDLIVADQHSSVMSVFLIIEQYRFFQLQQKKM
jgi:hypothetical protein